MILAVIAVLTLSINNISYLYDSSEAEACQQPPWVHEPVHPGQPGPQTHALVLAHGGHRGDRGHGVADGGDRHGDFIGLEIIQVMMRFASI